MSNASVWDICSKEVVIGFPDQSVKEIVAIMVNNKFRRIPIVEKDEKTPLIKGIVTATDVIKAIAENNDFNKLKETKIENIMCKDIITTNPTTTINELARLLLDHNIGGVPVLDTNNRLIGIVTIRDIVKYMGKLPIKSPVIEFANTSVPSVLENAPLADVVEIMARENLRYVIILDSEQKLAGIITSTDILRLLDKSDFAPTLLQEDVQQCMSKDLIVAEPGVPLEVVIDLMLEHNIGVIPLSDDLNRNLGVLTEKELLLVEMQQKTASHVQ